MEQRIGRYPIIREIASGGQATVYLGRDLRLGREVAIKVLHQHHSNDSEYLKRFDNEAKTAAALSHPNITVIHEVGEDAGRHYIVMEYLPTTLHNLIVDKGQLPLGQALNIARQVALALQLAHGRNVIHRDLKPQNILISDDGVPKVTDFGIAWAGELSAVTRAGAIMGTPQYMSPEQARGTSGTNLDGRSDVYSLGIILCEMLTGHTPLEEMSGNEVIAHYAAHQDVPLGLLNEPIVPIAAAKIIRRALAAERDQRHQSAAALAQELETAWEFLNQDNAIPNPGLEVAEEPVTPIQSANEKQPKEKSSEDEAGEQKIQPQSPKNRLVGVASLLGLIILLALGGKQLGFFSFFLSTTPEPTVVVAHWTTGHLTRDGLLKEMAVEFNKIGHRSDSGTKIIVEVYDAPSELIGKYLSERLNFGTRRDLNKETNGYVVENIPDPTIVTPSSAHWLVTANFEVGRDIVNFEEAKLIVKPVIGIVTYEDMARCLGWPEKQLGFADIIALKNDPQGWASYPCAKAEWGQKPLLAFTDPTTSSTGRSLHLSLYAMAAGKAPQDLNVADVNDPGVVAKVKEFQGLIDHYLIGTTVLNTKIYQGPRYGHFFVMPEDNLIHLYEGTERAYSNGIRITAPPIDTRMVMIYPKEGSMPRNNCACIVDADWVSEEQVKASELWIDFIREEKQQRAFMAAGFRPGTDLDLNYVGSKISKEFGLDPNEPRIVLNPSRTKPEVAAAIDENWEQVKRPGIVTFIIDTSGSMQGEKMQQAKDGLVRALDTMAQNNQVGLVPFDDVVRSPIPVAPLNINKFTIADALQRLRARGETSLYDAIKRGIEMTDFADGAPDAIRAVVVLTDGQANVGNTWLSDIISIESRSEEPILGFKGKAGDTGFSGENGVFFTKAEMIGTGLALETRHDIQIFFIGIGDDADLDVGRLLAQATGAEFQGVAEDDLAVVLEEFSRYF